MKFSAVVIVGGKYDKKIFKKCLDSLCWADEIIQIHTDDSKTSNFAEFRNESIKIAKGEWLVYIDTDEVVPQELEKEVKSVVKSTSYSAFAIPRKNIVFGKEMKHCGLWPDYVLRLIRKDKLVKWEGELHEQPKIKGKVGYLKNYIIHYKHDNLSDMVEKTNKWSEIEGRLMYESGHPRMNIIRFASAGFREFWLRMIRQMAFLDGVEGVVYAIYQVFSRLISYSKLWEMQLKEK